jgi:uncharacterized membrane protein YfcA
MAFALADITLIQALGVAATAFGASIVGGVAGYGTGLLLPLVLVPIIGAEATVPVIAVTALFTNAGRALALRPHVDWRMPLLMLPLALPLVIFAAQLFTRFDERGSALVIGSVLMLIVPLRHLLKRSGYTLGTAGLVLAGGVYGFVTGTSTGAGVLLVSALMAGGLTGVAVVATDAVISIIIGLAKVATFGTLGALPPALVVLAILIGLVTLPGGYVARLVMERLPGRMHTAILDAVVLFGGALMIWRVW